MSFRAVGIEFEDEELSARNLRVGAFCHLVSCKDDTHKPSLLEKGDRFKRWMRFSHLQALSL